MQVYPSASSQKKGVKLIHHVQVISFPQTTKLGAKTLKL
jgi:hypothetical protein